MRLRNGWTPYVAAILVIGTLEIGAGIQFRKPIREFFLGPSVVYVYKN